jgi:hypothetical protein
LQDDDDDDDDDVDEQYSVKNTGCEIHHYAIFSTISLPPF